MDNYKLITITYAGDVAHMYYHALSLARFWKGAKKWTIVAEDGEYTADWCVANIVPLLPEWDIDVVLPPTLAATDGWHRQQFLKLWSASVATEEWVVILDAKNILIKEVNASLFFDGDVALVQVFNKDHVHSREHVASCSMLKLDYTQLREIFCITPFVWKPKIVNAVLNKLTANGYNIFNMPVMVGTEASVYWAVAQTVGLWIAVPSSVQGQYGGITLETRLSTNELEDMIVNIKNDQCIKFFTIHRFHTTPSNLRLVNIFLHELGVINEYDIEKFKSTFVKHIKFLRPEVQEFLRIDWNA